jgi:hypothetical protein
VARICSGTVRLRLERGVILITNVTQEQKYLACELHERTYQAAMEQNLYSAEEALGLLMELGLWTEEKQKLLLSLPKEIEQFKVGLLDSRFRSSENASIRKALTRAKETLHSLQSERNVYYHYSANGVADMAKARLLLAFALRYPDGRPVFADEEAYWNSEDTIIEEAMVTYGQTRLDEATLRELARTDPWRSIWNARTTEGKLFGVPASMHTEEQIALVEISSLYEKVYSSPDCPDEEILSDDDMFDGWLIKQKRKHESELKSRNVSQDISNEKISKAQEVFLVAENDDDARRVMELNDDFARSIQKQRFSYLNKKGVVNEQDMPDTQRKIKMELNRMMKGG